MLNRLAGAFLDYPASLTIKARDSPMAAHLGTFAVGRLTQQQIHPRLNGDISKPGRRVEAISSLKEGARLTPCQSYCVHKDCVAVRRLNSLGCLTTQLQPRLFYCVSENKIVAFRCLIYCQLVISGRDTPTLLDLVEADPVAIDPTRTSQVGALKRWTICLEAPR
jgi:hypothetical protein